MVTVNEVFSTDTKEMRAYFAQTMTELAAADERIVYLAADLMGTLGMNGFAKQFPERAINTGIAEANMAGIAAGLSATGKIPFIHSFAPFATRRCFDQIFLSCAYAKLNVKVIGSDPGVTAAFNGGTHMPFEDIGIMRTIPGITIVEPADSVQMVDLIKTAAADYGVWYIRFTRKLTKQLYAAGSHFTPGKAALVRPGTDVTLVAVGTMVAVAAEAAELLAAEGISARVLDLVSVKPIDADALVTAAKETGCLVTCENHNIIGGVGSAVAEVLSIRCPAPLEMLGINDVFGEVGPEGYLRERFQLTAPYIAAKAKAAIARK